MKDALVLSTVEVGYMRSIVNEEHEYLYLT